MADVEAFDKAGLGGTSSAGVVIHETVEQLEKAKLGLLPNEWSKTATLNEPSPEFDTTHKIASDAEGRVNGNERLEGGQVYLERDGTKTFQAVHYSHGVADVQKIRIR